MSKHTDVQTTSEYHEVIFFKFFMLIFLFNSSSYLFSTRFCTADKAIYPWNFECRPYHI